jgi:hypothetical protein
VITAGEDAQRRWLAGVWHSGPATEPVPRGMADEATTETGILLHRCGGRDRTGDGR